jgi:PTH1 family peptidyl-tRNA hydrolase
MKFLVAGLGNPGQKYQDTRHNSGFIILDEIAAQKELSWKKSLKISGYYAADNDFYFLKPETYMNHSGQSVSQALSYFKLSAINLCLIHDDADIAKLQFKVQFGRQAAGHHGVEDVIKHLGTEQFWRIRLGLGRPQEKTFDLEKWVLKRYLPEDLEALKKLAPIITRELQKIKSSS